MLPTNIVDEMKSIYGVSPNKCYIEEPSTNPASWSYKEEYRDKILGYLQKDYGVVILPFTFDNKKILFIKTY